MCGRPSTFASGGFGGGPELTIEQYAEELEAVLIRATAETAAARQDHLEVDMQLKSVMRQLVGLKVDTPFSGVLCGTQSNLL